MSKHVLSKKDLKTLITRMESIGIDVSSLSPIEIEEKKKDKIYYYSGKPIIFNNIPTIYLLNYLKLKDKTITVDDGAVPHINNGSSLFAPGIINMDTNIKRDDIVYIKNKEGYFIAVGISTRDGKDIMSDKKGEAAKVIHHLNDRIMNDF